MHPKETRILLIEDDDKLADLLMEYLIPHGFSMSRVPTGDAGMASLLQQQPDLVILDLMLPKMDGFEVCRRVRDAYSGAILMLTASQSEADHVTGLELGADDFITKPVEPRVLLARIRSQLRNRHRIQWSSITDQNRILAIDTLQVNVPARRVHVDGELIHLTVMEFDILKELAQNAGTVVRRDDLYTQVLGIEYDGIDRGLDVHISRIRRKLERANFDTRRLQSVRAVGYLLTSR